MNPATPVIILDKEEETLKDPFRTSIAENGRILIGK